jgi:hypothetical protein
MTDKKNTAAILYPIKIKILVPLSHTHAKYYSVFTMCEVCLYPSVSNLLIDNELVQCVAEATVTP